MKRADKRKHHYIYKIVREDGKYYIGMHSTDDLEDGYFGSGVLLWKSIRKHGKEKHRKEIMEFLDSREELKKREKELVNEELLGDVLCMNLKLGGDGGGRFRDEEHRLKCSAAGSKFAKIANAARIAKLKANPELKDKWYAKVKFKPDVQRMGTDSAWNESARLKRKKTFEENKHQSGEKNSQFGSMWITDGAENKKIKKDSHIPDGWKQGRSSITIQHPV